MNAFSASWEKLSPLPEPNGGFVPFVDNGQVVVAGGTNWEGSSKNWLRSLHVLNGRTLAWESNSKLEEPAAYGIGLPGGFVGGTDGRKPVKTLFHSVEGKLSSKSLPQLPDAIILSAGGMLKSGNMILVGGSPDAADLTALSKTALAITSALKVELLPDYPGQPFAIAGSATLGERLYIFGGAHWDAVNKTVLNTADAYSFAMESKTWKKLTSFQYAVRGLCAVALDDHQIYLAGGYKNDTEAFTDEAFIYDILKDEYRPAKPLPYRAMVGLVVCEGYVYCLGGEDKQKSRTDACFRIPVAELLK